MYEVQVIDKTTKRVVKRVSCSNYHEAEKVEDRIIFCMDYEDYVKYIVKIVKAKGDN